MIKGIMALSAAAAGWCLVENNRLTTDFYTIKLSNLPDSFDGKIVLHLSDLHQRRYGENFDRLIERCSIIKPDYIFFTGDLFTRTEDILDRKILLMRRLLELAPVYYVIGNHEADVPNKAKWLCRELKRIGVNVLVNQCVTLCSGGECINIYGAAFDISCYKSPGGGYGNITPINGKTLDGLLGKPDRGGFNILLTHNPLAFEEYAAWGADLTFAGHVHGGVIRLPGIGGLLSPERRFFPKYTKGIYSCGDAKMEVSAGLGKFRLLNPAQVVYVRMKKDLKG